MATKQELRDVFRQLTVRLEEAQAILRTVRAEIERSPLPNAPKIVKELNRAEFRVVKAMEDTAVQQSRLEAANTFNGIVAKQRDDAVREKEMSKRQKQLALKFGEEEDKEEED